MVIYFAANPPRDAKCKCYIRPRPRFCIFTSRQQLSAFYVTCRKFVTVWWHCDTYDMVPSLQFKIAFIRQDGSILIFDHLIINNRNLSLSNEIHTQFYPRHVRVAACEPLSMPCFNFAQFSVCDFQKRTRWTDRRSVYRRA